MLRLYKFLQCKMIVLNKNRKIPCICCVKCVWEITTALLTQHVANNTTS